MTFKMYPTEYAELRLYPRWLLVVEKVVWGDYFKENT